jgi:N-acetylneuraminic acid mutarotase
MLRSSKIGLILFIGSMFWVQSTEAQLLFNQRPAFPGQNRDDGIGFALNTFIFFGTGMNSGFQTTNDFWKLDPVANIWTQVADFGGTPRQYCCSFTGEYSVGNNFGYVFGGIDSQGVYQNDLWMYDMNTNAWQQKNSLPGPGRMGACSWTTTSGCFIGIGRKNNTTTLNDLWLYNCQLDTWAQQPSLPGIPRYLSMYLYYNENSANELILTCGLDSNSACLNETWTYNINSSTWTARSPFPGLPRYDGVSISIPIWTMYAFGLGKGSNGNYCKDFYRCFPPTYIWYPVTPIFPGTGRKGATSISYPYNAGAYIICGIDSTNSRLNEVWNVDVQESIEEPGKDLFVQLINKPNSTFTLIFPVNFSGSFELFDLSGKRVMKEDWKNITEKDITVPGRGIYIVSLRSDEGKVFTSKILVK